MTKSYILIGTNIIVTDNDNDTTYTLTIDQYSKIGVFLAANNGTNELIFCPTVNNDDSNLSPDSLYGKLRLINICSILQRVIPNNNILYP